MADKPLKSHLELIWKNFISLIRVIDYRALLACIVLTVATWPLILSGLIQPTKPVMEIAAVVITGLFTVALAVRLALTRHLFLLWGAALMAIAMCREIHFIGSDEILLIGWPILLGIAVCRYDLFEIYFKNPVLINILAVGFLFYFLSQTVDQRWWRGLPGESVVHVRLEELVELFGHCTVGAALLFCKPVRQTETPTGTFK